MRAGQTPADAVEDIIRQGVTELRKRAFGDDADDARSLPWSREHAWALLRALARRDTVPYHEILVNSPFKGEENALRSMERAEMITVDARNGRPSAIRPGRPIYRYVFQRLVDGDFFFLSCTVFATYVYRLLPTQIQFSKLLKISPPIQNSSTVLKRLCVHVSRSCRPFIQLGLTRDGGGVVRLR